jgi:hypothetical protein
VPYGLQKAPDGVQVPHPEEAPVVASALGMKGIGMTAGQAAGRMNHIARRRDGSVWTRTKVTRLWNNETLYRKTGVL